MTSPVDSLKALAPAVEQLAVILLQLAEECQQLVVRQGLDFLLRQLRQVIRLLAIGHLREYGHDHVVLLLAKALAVYLVGILCLVQCFLVALGCAQEVCQQLQGRLQLVVRTRQVDAERLVVLCHIHRRAYALPGLFQLLLLQRVGADGIKVWRQHVELGRMQRTVLVAQREREDVVDGVLLII